MSAASNCGGMARGAQCNRNRRVTRRCSSPKNTDDPEKEHYRNTIGILRRIPSEYCRNTRGA
eukprot:4624635-Lingulodinium_polyedra.AAC.1